MGPFAFRLVPDSLHTYWMCFCGVCSQGFSSSQNLDIWFLLLEHFQRLLSHLSGLWLFWLIPCCRMVSLDPELGCLQPPAFDNASCLLVATLNNDQEGSFIVQPRVKMGVFRNLIILLGYILGALTAVLSEWRGSLWNHTEVGQCSFALSLSPLMQISYDEHSLFSFFTFLNT